MARRSPSGEQRGLLGWAIEQAGLAAGRVAVTLGRAGAGVVSTIAAAIRSTIAQITPGTAVNPVQVNAQARAIYDSSVEARAHNLALLAGDPYTTQLQPQIGAPPGYTYHVEADAAFVKGGSFERIYGRITSDAPLDTEALQQEVATILDAVRSHYEIPNLHEIVVNTITVIDVTRGIQ